jgi:hypothetical protein
VTNTHGSFTEPPPAPPPPAELPDTAAADDEATADEAVADAGAVADDGGATAAVVAAVALAPELDPELLHPEIPTATTTVAIAATIPDLVRLRIETPQMMSVTSRLRP